MPAKHEPAAEAPAAEAPVVEEQPLRISPGLNAQEEAQLGNLRAKVAAASGGGPAVRLKVEEPHSEVTYGGVTVGREFTEVPAAVAADLVSGAAEAGVTVTQDQES
jgi:hypothetical protein